MGPTIWVKGFDERDDFVGEERYVQVKVLAFAWAKDAIGAERIEVELPEGATVGGLMRQLAESHPRLAERAESMTVAVNEEFVGPDFSVHAGDEVALIPPISGGRLVSDL